MRDKNRVFMSVALTLSQLSTCNRNHVGAVIVKDGRCVTWGYNGAPPGLPHCEENNHGWHETDWPVPGSESPKAWEISAIEKHGCKNATHAEANALAFAAKHGISTDGAVLYVTLSPCSTCSRLLIAAGISAVHFLEQYRDTTAIDLLQRAGVKVWAILPSV